MARRGGYPPPCAWVVFSEIESRGTRLNSPQLPICAFVCSVDAALHLGKTVVAQDHYLLGHRRDRRIGVVAGILARVKRRDHSFWAAWSFLFPPMLLILLVMPANKGPRPRRPGIDEIEERGEL